MRKTIEPVTVTVTCQSCQDTAIVEECAPAAPQLYALTEVLRKTGWTYQLGFGSMLTGNYYPQCPKCSSQTSSEGEET